MLHPPLPGVRAVPTPLIDHLDLMAHLVSVAPLDLSAFLDLTAHLVSAAPLDLSALRDHQVSRESLDLTAPLASVDLPAPLVSVDLPALLEFVAPLDLSDHPVLTVATEVAMVAMAVLLDLAPLLMAALASLTDLTDPLLQATQVLLLDQRDLALSPDLKAESLLVVPADLVVLTAQSRTAQAHATWDQDPAQPTHVATSPMLPRSLLDLALLVASMTDQAPELAQERAPPTVDHSTALRDHAALAQDPAQSTFADQLAHLLALLDQDPLSELPPSPPDPARLLSQSTTTASLVRTSSTAAPTDPTSVASTLIPA